MRCNLINKARFKFQTQIHLKKENAVRKAPLIRGLERLTTNEAWARCATVDFIPPSKY